VVGEPRLTELPARYNAAETFIDSHRGVRESTIAIRCQGKSVTYGELASNVDRCGNAFRELGIELEQRILILCLDSPAFVYAFFGAIKIGAVPVPTNTLLTPRDLAYILNDSRAVAVVVSVLLLGGSLFCLVASVGIIRLPDIYSRMHAASKAGTVGSGLLLLAAGIHAQDFSTLARALAGFLFFILTAPISAHLLAKTAHNAGYFLSTLSVRDDLK